MPITTFDTSLLRLKYKVREMEGDADFAQALANALDCYVDVKIPTASVLTMNATPVTIVAAPASGFAAVPLAMYSSMVYNSATYACNASGASLFYTNGSGVQPTGFTLTQSYIQSGATSQLFLLGGSTAYVPTAAAPLVLVAASSNPTTGNSDIKIRLFYKVVPVPILTV